MIVLVVDDYERVRERLADALRAGGHELLPVGSRDAVDCARERRPDVIVVEGGLIEMLSPLRRAARGALLVMLTPRGDALVAAAARTLGADLYLTIDELPELVAALAERARDAGGDPPDGGTLDLAEEERRGGQGRVDLAEQERAGTEVDLTPAEPPVAADPGGA